MRITSFRIKNYKSFVDSGELVLSDRYNVIIGQNNVGKTALLEALSLTFTNKPHKSLLTLPLESSIINPQSTAQITFTVKGEEVREMLLAMDSAFNIPVPDGTHGASATKAIELLDRIMAKQEIQFSLEHKGPGNWALIQFPTFGIYSSNYDQQNGHALFYVVRPKSDKSGFTANADLNRRSAHDEVGIAVADILKRRIYSFRAERLNVGSCPFGHNETLSNDARNLPEVLNALQSNPQRFRKFNELVTRIFPSIFWISVVASDGAFKILVWTEDPNHSRRDLAIDLSESGTGVGQVLAILYVAITSSKFSIPIIIDEPNSFLHPGAARKLIETLKEFANCQYIISTHSPEIVRATNPSTLTLLRWEKPQTRIEALNANEVTELRECLLEVGVKLSDVFGADRILWVEGDTEEECFPELLKGTPHWVGTTVVRVRNTGEFESRRMAPKAIVEIYKNLSLGKSILPPTLAFVFDREDRTPDEMESVISQSCGLVHFLPRRMYENYLLSPEALCAVMNELPHFRPDSISVEEVSQWILDNGSNPKYEAASLTVFGKEWLEKVHAGKLLNELFDQLSQNRYVYRKTEYGVRLTSWLLKNQYDSIKELADFLLSIIENAEKTGSDNQSLARS
jgi:predicted ATPase